MKVSLDMMPVNPDAALWFVPFSVHSARDNPRVVEPDLDPVRQHMSG